MCRFRGYNQPRSHLHKNPPGHCVPPGTVQRHGKSTLPRCRHTVAPPIQIPRLPFYKQPSLQQRIRGQLKKISCHLSVGVRDGRRPGRCGRRAGDGGRGCAIRLPSLPVPELATGIAVAGAGWVVRAEVAPAAHDGAVGAAQGEDEPRPRDRRRVRRDVRGGVRRRARGTYTQHCA